MKYLRYLSGVAATARGWTAASPEMRRIWSSDAHREQRARDLIAYYVHVGDSSQN